MTHHNPAFLPDSTAAKGIQLAVSASCCTSPYPKNSVGACVPTNKKRWMGSCRDSWWLGSPWITWVRTRCAETGLKSQRYLHCHFLVSRWTSWCIKWSVQLPLALAFSLSLGGVLRVLKMDLNKQIGKSFCELPSRNGFSNILLDATSSVMWANQ